MAESTNVLPCKGAHKSKYCASVFHKALVLTEFVVYRKRKKSKTLEKSQILSKRKGSLERLSGLLRRRIRAIAIEKYGIEDLTSMWRWRKHPS